MLTLDQLKNGDRAVVKEVVSKGAGLIRRLAQLGVAPGALIEVVFNSGIGPVVVRVHGAEIAIGRGLARKVLVEVVE